MSICRFQVSTGHPERLTASDAERRILKTSILMNFIDFISIVFAIQKKVCMVYCPAVVQVSTSEEI